MVQGGWVHVAKVTVIIVIRGFSSIGEREKEEEEKGEEEGMSADRHVEREEEGRVGRRKRKATTSRGEVPSPVATRSRSR